MAKTRFTAAMALLLTAAAACTENASSQKAVDSNVSPTSSAANKEPVPPEVELTMKRYIARGDGRACSNPAVLKTVGGGDLDQSFNDDLWVGDSEAQFWSAYTARISEITVEGVQPESQRIWCAGNYEASVPGWTNSTRVYYEVQSTVDGGYVVRTTNPQDLRDTASALKTPYWRENIKPLYEAEMKRRSDAYNAQVQLTNQERGRRDRLAREELGRQNQIESDRQSKVDRIEYVGPPPNIPGPPIRKDSH